jgi:hypothetical protein
MPQRAIFYHLFMMALSFTYLLMRNAWITQMEIPFNDWLLAPQEQAISPIDLGMAASDRILFLDEELVVESDTLDDIFGYLQENRKKLTLSQILQQ